MAQDRESSLSWRRTRPARVGKRIARRLRSSAPSPEDAATPGADRFDSWLVQYHGERLAAIDAACADGSDPASFSLFRDLDDDLWALLLTQQYEVFPHIRALLPTLPEPALQEIWNGRSGVPLAAQTKAFYSKLRDSYERHAGRPLSAATVLDFGCGWGRVTRFLARDVAPGRLYGCDPVQGILDLCRATGVPATLARSAFLPDEVPFEQRFDLAFAFSVFTHLSERAHQRCLTALHRALAPGGILVVTIRPPAYLNVSELMHPLRDSLGADAQASLERVRYLFAPHPATPEHPQSSGPGEIDYGEAIVTMAYVREHWSSRFELLEVSVPLDDPYQVVLTMRRA